MDVSYVKARIKHESIRWWYRLTRPAWREFVDMGLGIEWRYRLCKDEWDKHIARTKAYQQQCMQNESAGDSIAVLGAGRLLDVDFPSLCKRFDRIELFDADPSVVMVWRRLKKSDRCQTFTTHLVDLTSCMEAWKTALQKVLNGPGNKRRLIDFFNSLEIDSRVNPVGNFDTVLSVNMLGQIPIYWRDHTYKTVPRYWKLTVGPSGFEQKDIQEALNSSLRKLQLHHLDLLRKSASKKIILVSDVSYTAVQQGSPCWTEPALHFDHQNLQLEDFRCVSIDAWNWHIAPQGVERLDYGSTHEVHAWEFQRIRSTAEEQPAEPQAIPPAVETTAIPNEESAVSAESPRAEEIIAAEVASALVENTKSEGESKPEELPAAEVVPRAVENPKADEEPKPEGNAKAKESADSAETKK